MIYIIHQLITAIMFVQINCARMEDISITQYQHKDPGITSISVAALSIQVLLDEKLQKYDIASVGISIRENFHMDKDSPKSIFNRIYCRKFNCITSYTVKLI